MITDCPVPADIGMVRVLLGNVDCGVAVFVQDAYTSMASPGSPVMLTLTALLTIYVAFIGYRLLLGRTRLSVGNLSVAALKIGVVLALATSWGFHQAGVYDALYSGPQQMTAGMLGSLQPEGSAFRGDPIEGLQLAFDEMQRDADAFAKRAGATASPLMGGVAFGAMSLNGASMLLLISTLGVLMASKVVLAILLALAPAIAGLLLFDATRGMIAGWLKAMVALALLPLTTTIVLAVELTMLEPSLAALADNVQAGNFALNPVIESGMLILVFTMVLAAAVLAGTAIARGIRLPWTAGNDAQTTSATSIAPSATREPMLLATPPRATRIAAAAAAVARREARTDAPAARLTGGDRRTIITGASATRGADLFAGATPLGQSFRRPVRPRRSAAAQRRDR